MTSPGVEKKVPLEFDSADALEIACAEVGRDPNPAYVKDSELRYIAVNEAYAALLDVTASELIGQQSDQHFDSVEHCDRDEKERRSLVFGKEQVAFFAHPMKNLRYRIRVERARDAGGKQFITGHFEPLNGVRFENGSKPEPKAEEAKRPRLAPMFEAADNAEHSLRGDHALLRAAVEASTVPMAVEDREGRLIAASGGYLAYGGDLTETDLPAGGRLLIGQSKQSESEKNPATLASVARAVEGVNARLHEALDKIDVGIILYGPDDKFVYANPALHKLIEGAYEMKPGMSRKDVLRAAWASQGILEGCDDWVVSRMENHHAYGKVFVDKLGNGRWLRMVNQKLADGSILGLRVDVTELVQRERALADKEMENGLYRAVLEELPVPTFIKDENNKFIFVNHAFTEFTGTSAETLMGDDGSKVLVKPREPVIQSDLDVLRTGEPIELEVHVPVQEGRERVSLTRKARFTSRKGDHYLLCSTMDITALKDREIELSAARETAETAASLLGLATGAMAQGLMVVVDDKIRFSNAKFRSLMKIPDEMVKPGCDWRDYVNFCAERGDLDEFGREETLAQIIDCAENGQSYQSERCLPDGTWVKVNTQPTADNTLVITYTDITDAKNREARLSDLVARTEAADRAKSEFLANMSHEIRTPMNGVLGMAELLARTNLDSRQKTFTDIIVKSGTALLTIINDILDFSKIDAGQLVLEPAPFDLRETIEDVATLVSTRAVEKDVELIVRIDPSLDARVVGDVGRMRQILTNMIGNAVKFTEVGHVLVELNAVAADGDRLDVSLRVEDTGVGIPAEKLDTVFEKFSQVDASSTRRHEGTGLGLAITARLVELMGGRVAVESEVGVGSVFTVSLTLPRDSGYVPVAPPRIDIEGARVLVIDDNAVNRQIMSEQLTAWGLDGCAASSGDEGEGVLEAAARYGMRVDALILDYHMPDRNGAEVARSIRARYSAEELPILMLTSMDVRVAEPDFADLDIQATLMKPARSGLLLETLAGIMETGDSIRHYRKGASSMTSAVAHTPQIAAPPLVPEDEATASITRGEGDWLEEMHARHAGVTPSADQAPVQAAQGGTLDILVAEDNEVNQIVFTQILEQMGANYMLVADGAAAVEAWREHRPAIILMDVSMPDMNGYEATGAIREAEAADPALARTPVVGVTAHALAGDRERCLEAGMDDYLSKPISPEKLEAKIRDWIPEVVAERFIRTG
jgi:PAS domain S-box-containing protein